MKYILRESLEGLLVDYFWDSPLLCDEIRTLLQGHNS